MLKLSLNAVDRGEVRLRDQVPPDHEMWADADVDFAAPVDVDMSARSVGDGMLVRGTLRTRVRIPCRRCVSTVECRVDETVDMLFEPLSDVEEEEVAGEVYPLPNRGTELDLSDAIREQLLLHVPQYALCREECRGLCPKCGTDLNEAACDCVSEQAPSPWDALKKLDLD